MTGPRPRGCGRRVVAPTSRRDSGSIRSRGYPFAGPEGAVQVMRLRQDRPKKADRGTGRGRRLRRGLPGASVQGRAAGDRRRRRPARWLRDAPREIATGKARRDRSGTRLRRSQRTRPDAIAWDAPSAGPGPAGNIDVCEKSPSEPDKEGQKHLPINQAGLQCRIGRNIVSAVNTDALWASLEWKGALSPRSPIHTFYTYLNIDSTAKTLPLDREAERFVAIALAPLRLSL
jgi:hypothetical protein